MQLSSTSYYPLVPFGVDAIRRRQQNLLWRHAAEGSGCLQLGTQGMMTSLTAMPTMSRAFLTAHKTGVVYLWDTNNCAAPVATMLPPHYGDPPAGGNLGVVTCLEILGRLVLAGAFGQGVNVWDLRWAVLLWQPGLAGQANAACQCRRVLGKIQYKWTAECGHRRVRAHFVWLAHFRSQTREACQERLCEDSLKQARVGCWRGIGLWCGACRELQGGSKELRCCETIKITGNGTVTRLARGPGERQAVVAAVDSIHTIQLNEDGSLASTSRSSFVGMCEYVVVDCRVTYRLLCCRAREVNYLRDQVFPCSLRRCSLKEVMECTSNESVYI